MKAELNSVLIQTNRKCTKKCSHCFYGQYPEFTSNELMPIKVVEKILDDLRDINYKGRVSLYANNEPLTDVRILQFLEMAKRKLPKAFHFMQTNGDLLDEKMAQSLLEYLDRLQVNSYEVQTEFQSDDPRLQVANKAGKRADEWSNKGGSLLGIGREPSTTCCQNTFRQLYVAPSGNVLICPADGFERHVMGNVKNENLITIWMGEKFRTIRGLLLDGKRGQISICSKCDSETGQLMEIRREKGELK